MKKTRIAALGDSLTRGVVLADNRRYSLLENSYMNILGEELGLFVENFGKFGCTVGFADTVIDRHSDNIAASDYTFIEYGGNDCDFDWMKIAESPSGQHSPRTLLASFTEHMLMLVEKVKRLGSRPVLVSLPPILSERYFSFFSNMMSEGQKDNVMKWLGGDVNIISRWHEAYNRALFNVACRSQVDIIDITSPFDTYRGDLNGLYCMDGIHPNAAGHKLIAETIINRYL